MKNNLENLLRIGVIGTVLAGGCMAIPEAGDFPKEKVLVAVPSHPVVMLLNAGVYECEKINVNGELTGIDITKKHWLVGKTGNQRLYFPENSENVGVKETPFPIFIHNFWLGYDLNGDRKIDKYDVSWDGKKSKLVESYIFNNKEKKFIRGKYKLRN